MNIKKKLLIIYLYPYIFRKFHWEVNEFKYYKEFADIEIHELYKVEYPHLSNFILTSNNKKDEYKLQYTKAYCIEQIIKYRYYFRFF